MVHFFYRGRCNAAILTDFWEDEQTAFLSVFERGGMTTRSRSLKGKKGEDAKWHTLAECPVNMAVASKAKTSRRKADEPVESGTGEG